VTLNGYATRFMIALRITIEFVCLPLHRATLQNSRTYLANELSPFNIEWFFQVFENIFFLLIFFDQKFNFRTSEMYKSRSMLNFELNNIAIYRNQKRERTGNLQFKCGLNGCQYKRIPVFFVLLFKDFLYFIKLELMHRSKTSKHHKT
jgi:hypothetical protein